MNDTLGLTPEQLRSIPLLRGLSDAQLSAFGALFSRVTAQEGDVLFEVGQHAEALYLLVQGEISLVQTTEETHRLTGPVIIGELGALSGLERNSQAIVGAGCQLWQVGGAVLREFFTTNSALGVAFQQTLLAVVADKVDRDQTRLIDMRRNLIRTQKAMKKMRDFLLESPDTAVSETMHEILDGLIRQNRRVNYRVEPPVAIASTLRLDGGEQLPVLEISRTHLSFEQERALPAIDQRLTGVLNLSGPELPISGRVLRTIDQRVDIELDLLIDEYVGLLEGYLTRIQMLDFLV